MRTPEELSPLPDYLVEVVAKEHYERDRPTIPWREATDIVRNGCREAAKVILRARAAQSDIKR
ncbi:MAG: hypothetical protein ACPGFA_13045 [Pikeienuella sp.]